MSFLFPLGLAALILPLALLLTSLRRRDPLTVWLGTSRFFGEPKDGEESRPSGTLSPARIAAILSLTLAAVGLAKPGSVPALPEGAVVEVHLDRSPSMGLPLDPGDPEGQTRMGAALKRFSRWAEDFESELSGRLYAVVPSVSPERVEWRDVLEVLNPIEAAPLGDGELGARSFQGPGTLWITDRAPLDSELRSGGVFASGGAAVPGVISMGAEGALVWDPKVGETFSAERARPGTVFLGAGLASPVERIVRLWAEDRGAIFVESLEGADLVLSRAEPQGPPNQGDLLTVLAGRDGWSLPIEASPRAGLLRPLSARGSQALTPWLMTGKGRVLVAHGPGVVILDFASFGKAPPLNAAFAVSWTQLFDLARRSPRGVVGRHERLEAGVGMSRPPSRVPSLEEWEASAGVAISDTRLEREEAARRARRTRGWLMGAAALLGFLALLLRVRSGA